jgi:hypothetical protein
MDNQQALQQLRDIHLPPPISGWPLAPGWYVLIVSVLLVIVGIIFWFYKQRIKARAKRHALRLLTHTTTHAAISALLKRVALAYYPRARVANLHGEAWIKFLNETARGVNFHEVQAALIDAPYQINPKARDLAQLIRMARHWIKQQGVRCLN